jgi:hypothetical protein
MPASLYRLASKPHHAETPAVSNQSIQEIEPTQLPDSIAIVEAEPQAQEAPLPQSAESDAPAETGVVSWDPNWTKTKLLDFALSLGLNVTSTNTKTEIISALTAATLK